MVFLIYMKSAFGRIEIDWKNLFEKMSIGFAVHRIVWNKNKEAVDIIYLEVNEAYEKLTGISRKKVIGNPTSKTMPGLEKEWYEIYGDVVKTGKSISFEKEAKPLGRVFRVYAFKSGEDEFATVFEDITISYKAENLVSESEAKYQAIVSCSQDAIVMMDNQGKITSWNLSAEKMFGYNEKEVLGKDLHQLITVNEEHRNKRGNLNIFFETGKSPLLGKIIELPVKKRNGEIFIIELTVSATTLNGKWFGVGVMRDITSRKKNEESKMETLNELETMNRLMVDREIKMMELKKEIESLKKQISN